MLWLKRTGREGIFDWAGGHWLSYDKIMEVCDQRTVTVATTSVVTTRPANTTTQVSVTTVPPNPGDTVGCADFATWQEAQDWYDTYAPHYGDVASIDGNNNGVACEKLLPDGRKRLRSSGHSDNSRNRAHHTGGYNHHPTCHHHNPATQTVQRPITLGVSERTRRRLPSGRSHLRNRRLPP